MNVATEYLPIAQCAAALNLPVTWLKQECCARRLPSVMAGRQMYANPELVQRTIDARSLREMRRAEASARREVTHA